MTAPVAATNAKAPTYPRGRRKGPHPASILDPAALRRALDEANLPVKAAHVTAFYHALHRQGYPSLPEFCDTYEFYDSRLGDREALAEAVAALSRVPLKNKVTARGNPNKVQLPKAFLRFLRSTPDLVTLTSRVAREQTSRDGTTTKLAVELQDGHVVESVLMRYSNPYTKSGRASLCVSSQVGCAMGCTFCATGTMGLLGNLTAGEILEQIVHADRILARERAGPQDENRDDAQRQKQPDNHPHGFVRNVVFMGMGEPLDNFTHVTNACRALIDPKRWNLAHHCVTVSTVGLVGQIRRLTAELPEVSLALSLHAPNQAAREAIVPTAVRYPIEQLVEALDHHMSAYKRKRRGNDTAASDNDVAPVKDSLRRRAMIEYVMLEGASSTMECAHELGRLCRGRSLLVNLIPYNPTNVRDRLRCPSEAHMQEFRRIVASYRVFCTIRRTMGADIDSACGQLVQEVLAQPPSPPPPSSSSDAVRDIEDAGGARAPARAAPGGRAAALDDDGGRPAAAAAGPCGDDGIDWAPWIAPLGVATAVSATCFLASAALYWRNRR